MCALGIKEFHGVISVYILQSFSPRRSLTSLMFPDGAVMKLSALCGHTLLLEWGLVFTGRGISRGRWRRCVTGRGCQSFLPPSHTSRVWTSATANKTSPSANAMPDLAQTPRGWHKPLVHEMHVNQIFSSVCSKW